VDRGDVGRADGLDRLSEQLREHAGVAGGIAARAPSRSVRRRRRRDGGVLGPQLQRRGLQLRGAVGAHQRGLTLELGRAPALGEELLGLGLRRRDQRRGVGARLGHDGLDLGARLTVEQSR
jgi:hypothetical protein